METPLDERFEEWRLRRVGVRSAFYLLTILWILLQILASLYEGIAGFLQGYTTLFWVPWLGSLFWHAWLEAQQEYFLKQVHVERLSEQDRVSHEQMLSQAKLFFGARLKETQLDMIQEWLQESENKE